jgi:lysophospholipase
MTLDPRFYPPDGFQWGGFTNAAGRNIRTGHIGNGKARIVILPGFREPIEQYFEVIREQAERGYEVFTLDWPGQGGSGRFLADPQRAHHEGYDEILATLHQFTQTIAPTPKPLLMLGHSMGGHIGLRYLREYPGVFKAAALSAPMVDINLGMPKWAARTFITLMGGAKATNYVPGGGPWAVEKDVFHGNDLTHDAARYYARTEIYRINEKLQMGDATLGWVYHTLRSVDVLHDETYLKSIKTPVLMQISGDEKIVDRAAAVRAAGLLPDCRRVDIDPAKHAIWMERDEWRDLWRAEVDKFFAPHLK